MSSAGWSLKSWGKAADLTKATIAYLQKQDFTDEASIYDIFKEDVEEMKITAGQKKKLVKAVLSLQIKMIQEKCPQVFAWARANSLSDNTIKVLYDEDFNTNEKISAMTPITVENLSLSEGEKTNLKAILNMSSFVYKWCEENKLPPFILKALISNGISEPDQLMMISKDKISQMELDWGQQHKLLVAIISWQIPRINDKYPELASWATEHRLSEESVKVLYDNMYTDEARLCELTRGKIGQLPLTQGQKTAVHSAARRLALKRDTALKENRELSSEEIDEKIEEEDVAFFIHAVKEDDHIEDLQCYRSPTGLPLLQRVVSSNNVKIVKEILTCRYISRTATDSQGRNISKFVWDNRDRISADIVRELFTHKVFTMIDIFIIACGSMLFDEKDVTSLLNQFHGSNSRDALNINDIGQMGVFALYAACRANKESIVRLLIDKGAAVKVTNQYRETPLWAASMKASSTIVKHLIDQVKNESEKVEYVNMSDVMETSPLLMTVSFKNNNVLEELINNKADINKADSNGLRPLWASVRDDNVHAVEILITAKAQDTEDQTQHVPMYEFSIYHYAARNGKAEALNVLLEKTSRDDAANLQDPKGDTPLHTSAQHEQPEAVQVLLHHDAKILPNNNEKTPLDIATEHKRKLETEDRKRKSKSPLVKSRNSKVEAILINWTHKHSTQSSGETSDKSSGETSDKSSGETSDKSSGETSDKSSGETSDKPSTSRESSITQGASSDQKQVKAVTSVIPDEPPASAAPREETPAAEDSAGAAEEDNDDDYEDVESEEDVLFSKRATLFYIDPHTNQRTQAGLGEIIILDDPDVVGGYRVTMISDHGDKLCNHIICRRYLQNLLKDEKKKYVQWQAKDYSTDDPIRRTFRAQFSSAVAVVDFVTFFSQGVENAKEFDINEASDVWGLTGEIQYEPVGDATAM